MTDPYKFREEKDNEVPNWQNQELPVRTASAPPILQEKNIFAWNPYASYFGESSDIMDNQTVQQQNYDNYVLPFYLTHNETTVKRGFDPLLQDVNKEDDYTGGESSPPFPRRYGLPRDFHDNNDIDNQMPPKQNSRDSHRLYSRKLTMGSSYDEYALDESQFLPDLSSDSESVSSSIDDLSSLLVQSFTLNGHNTSNPAIGFEEIVYPPDPDPTILERRVMSVKVEKDTLVVPATQNTVDLNHLEEYPVVSHEDSRPTGIPCRYYAQGYCSRGNRCSFAHVDPETYENTEGWNANSQSVSKRASTHKRSASTGYPQRSVPANNAPLTNSHPQPFGYPAVQPAQKKRGEEEKKTNVSFLMEAGRFTSVDQVVGQIYPMCKDQHGCRFLQKKLEEDNQQVVNVIYSEVYPHFAELMTDPFGNYLCQKLLEHCNDEQRLLLINSVASDLVQISEDMHGTRAVQTMIECLRNNEEIALVISGLRSSVVALIKDLNGNHVIQRCLNHLSAQNNQFIYDSVAGHCVEVATHRHGCCVLQRCIDHANENQKLQLITEIAANSLALVKDPYGNYVVQYVLDLPYPNLISMLISKLKGHLVELSTQKFSSNVVEKCLTIGNAPTRCWMVTELLSSGQLDALIQDPFGNYVVQTAMNVSDPSQHSQLVDHIKPYIPTLRNTPYGKRIQNKILKNGQNKRRQK